MSLEQFIQSKTDKSENKKDELVKKYKERAEENASSTKVEDIGINLEDEALEIRKKPLYKGRLAYVQDILFDACPELNAELIAERLDVSLPTARLLLLDCQKKREKREIG
jgi:RNA polymerase-binding transcription factor DksA